KFRPSGTVRRLAPSTPLSRDASFIPRSRSPRPLLSGLRQRRFGVPAAAARRRPAEPKRRPLRPVPLGGRRPLRARLEAKRGAGTGRVAAVAARRHGGATGLGSPPALGRPPRARDLA